MTLNEYLEIGERRFMDAGLYFGHGTDNAWDEAVMLAFFVLDLPPDSDRSVLATEVTVDQGEQILALYGRRVAERIPAPYLTGWAWFCHMPFRVDERVLIPRSPIGELIERAFEPWLKQTPATILDLCCGGGCLGIAAAHRFPDARAVLADISADALDVARENIRVHEVEGRVITVASDGFASIDGKFDLILCNPPYVDTPDLAAMPGEYRHEPLLALASGSEGLEFTRRLLAEAGNHLNRNGLLIGEVGNSWPALRTAFPGPGLEEVELQHGGGGVYCVTRQSLAQGRVE